MRIAVIGAGFSGLAASYYLRKKGLDVEIFEDKDKAGGLAIGFRRRGWDWSLEEHYHHWFTNDRVVLKLAKEINYNYKIYNPKTSVLYKDKTYRFDSPLSILKFPGLSLFSKLRTGLLIGELKIFNNWKRLEKISAKDLIIKKSGIEAWRAIWEPLFIGKFSNHVNMIPASWFWARVKKRTRKLAYPDKGFQDFTDCLAGAFTKLGGKINYKKKVKKIKYFNKFQLTLSDGKEMIFDKVVFTLSTGQLSEVVKDLPQESLKQFNELKGIGAATLVLFLKNSFLKDGTYWLNINDISYPFVSVVEHTNLIDKKNYNNESIVYIGNYLPSDHKYFRMSARTLLNTFFPYLKRINPEFNSSQILDVFLFKSEFAQPIVSRNYSNKIDNLHMPFKNLYLCNMQQIFPWDRGTNYAVENGYRVAKLVLKSN